MVEHELLILAIEEKWPDLVHGRDYWVGHPLDPVTGLQSGNAFIAEWKCDVDEPDIGSLLSRAEELRPVLVAEKVRARRDSLLAASDWTQAPDVPAGTREKWTAYRSALRDIPNQPGFPFDVEWPEAPTD
ncbi:MULTISPECIES: tail fiber assembly protein [unclassified Burkholderia]|uniref:tail fiber assembly protein n=1 Tax=unclassified Burkholderia TaxID=2613784 RepID=UPI0009E866CA|nr:MULTISPECIES: tail fiber assembly protein [unclassified Burkholderia]